MTANTDNAGAIAATLSAEEVKALKRLDNNAWCMPKNKSEAVAFRKFVELEWAHVDDFGHYRVTLAGREVLAVLAVASSEQPAEAGDSDMDALMGQIEAGYKSVNDRAAARGYIAALELQTRYEAAQAENADLRQQLVDVEAEAGRLQSEVNINASSKRLIDILLKSATANEAISHIAILSSDRALDLGNRLKAWFLAANANKPAEG